jgi:CheY-like chemotaxis protein
VLHDGLTGVLNDSVEQPCLLAHACGEAIEVNFDLQPSLPSCTIEPAQFTSLLLDLVMNGRDAMPRGGTLTVQTRTVVLNAAEAARLDDIAAGECIVVAVSDTGEGLVRDVRARAMDPFFTTRGAEAASGLGLSQVHDFVRRSGGRIEIESEPHEGTTVSLYLPVCDNVTAQAGGLAPITVHDRAAVLVVEDDPDLLEITIEAMRGFGYKVHHARDAAAGLAILDENPGVGLLFTDVVLPHGCDGVELARRAQLLRPTMHILLASGYPRAFLRDRAGLQDSMAFIAKPYSMSTLNLTLKLLAQAASRPSSPPN